MDSLTGPEQMLQRPVDSGSLLKQSQQAPTLLRDLSSRSSRFPQSLWSKPETPELWASLETLLLTCLTTGDDKSARECLERISKRFGPANERVMGLRGLYEEALAKDDAALENILEGYDSVLKENPVNVPILKRRIALLRVMSRILEAIDALVELLDAFPTDAEAWCELADVYQSQAMYSQACFCLEEALLVSPNAWNLHAKLGEVLYISTTQASESPETTLRVLSESIKRFCRSIELCDDYLRGYYGLYLSSTRFLELADTKGSKYGRGLPSRDVIRDLQKLCRAKVQNSNLPLKD